jgi:hypothetical protein
MWTGAALMVGGELLHNMAQHRIPRELLRVLGEAEVRLYRNLSVTLFC